VLLPVFFLLHMVTEFQPVLTLNDLFISVAAWLLGIPVFLYLIINYVKPLTKYAVVVLYGEVVFFFFAPIHVFLIRFIPLLSHYKYLLPLLTAGGILLILFARRKKTPPFRFYFYLNTLLIVLLLIECGQLIITSPKISKALSFNSSNNDLPTIPPCDSCIKPDVYFIIFDEFESSKGIKKLWQYDNSGLDSFLTDRGFYCASNSKSNYNFTPFSIGSILNMDYLTMKFDTDFNLLLYGKGIKTIVNNRVCRLFQQQGYTIINHSFFLMPGDEPRQNPAFLIDRPELLIAPTLYSRALNEIGWNFSKILFNKGVTEEMEKDARLNLQQIKSTYKELLAFAEQPHDKPVFVYGHIMLPHDPFFFDSTGHLTPESTWYRGFTDKDRYLPQLKYTSTLVKNMALRLQKPGNRPRIIIIQGDHGFRGFPDGMKELEFSNLNAIYFPDQQYADLYDSISSVNTFRVILHKYFNAPLPLLKDSTVYIRHFKK
jgi:hypothetical protein